MTVAIKRFDSPDERREFGNGKFEILHVGGMTLGRAIYQPGWKWSDDVGDEGESLCRVEHVGMVVRGCAAVQMDDGQVIELRAGDVFHVPPGHDSWVVGDESYESLHFLGASTYATDG